jgi:hypothetical protein
MSSTVFSVLIDKLEAEVENVTKFLVGGRAEDYAGYKEMCGTIRGLRAAQQEIRDLSRAYMEDDND